MCDQLILAHCFFSAADKINFDLPMKMGIQASQWLGLTFKRLSLPMVAWAPAVAGETNNLLTVCHGGLICTISLSVLATHYVGAPPG